MGTSEESWVRHLDTETRKSLAGNNLPLDRMVPGLTLLHHSDSRRIGERVVLPHLSSGREVEVSRVTPLFAAPGESSRRPLADPFLSRRPIRLIPDSKGGIRVLCRDTSTTVDIGDERVSQERLFSSAEVAAGQVLLLAERLVLLLHPLPTSPARQPRFGMIGDSPAISETRQEIQQVAALDGPVLIRGETGTGKELAARAIHRASPRASKPYLAVNMGALSSSLAAAELFGAAKGAFTGADSQRPGLFQSCDGGTLFLDEIGEAPAEIQVALLRVLEDGLIRPVGSERARAVDVRVLAATDADLHALIQQGQFRAPLWHRLSSCEVFLRPLRERPDDVGRLLVHFLGEELRAQGMGDRLAPPALEERPWLPASLVARLATCPWPGNVRQLRNVARRLVVDCRNQPEAQITPAVQRLLTLEPGDEPQPSHTRDSTNRSPRRRTFRPPEQVTEQELLDALREHRWRLLPTAAQLGVSRTALYGLIDRFPSIRRPADLSREDIEVCQLACQGDIEAMVDVLQVSRKGLRRRMTELGLP